MLNICTFVCIGVCLGDGETGRLLFSMKLGDASNWLHTLRHRDVEYMNVFLQMPKSRPTKGIGTHAIYRAAHAFDDEKRKTRQINRRRWRGEDAVRSGFFFLYQHPESVCLALAYSIRYPDTESHFALARLSGFFSIFFHLVFLSTGAQLGGGGSDKYQSYSMRWLEKIVFYCTVLANLSIMAIDCAQSTPNMTRRFLA